MFAEEARWQAIEDRLRSEDALDGRGGNIASGQPEETRARGSLACWALFPENRSFNTR